MQQDNAARWKQMVKYPSCYNSYEQYVEAQEAEKKLKDEIETAMIDAAPTEEIRLALLKATGRGA